LFLKPKKLLVYLFAYRIVVLILTLVVYTATKWALLSLIIDKTIKMEDDYIMGPLIFVY